MKTVAWAQASLAQASPAIVGASTPLATAGTVLATFAALLGQLQNLENFLISETDEKERSTLVDVMRRLSLQRNSFEDTAVELLCDVVPFANIAAFFTELGGLQWQKEEVQAQARKRLGSYVEVYCGTCAKILQGLDDIKDVADRVNPPEAMLDWEDEEPESVAWKTALRNLWEDKNLQVVTDLEEHNLRLRTVLYHKQKARRDQIQAANADIQTVLGLTAESSLGATEKLRELCQLIRRADENALSGELDTVAGTKKRSFQACLSGSRPCGAASTTPYETRSTLRLRWAINHLPDVTDFQPQSCCWPECSSGLTSSRLTFSSIATFLSHLIKCPCGNEAKYACLQRLERAWYDNRHAWELQSTSSHLQGLVLKSELRWPCEDRNFGQRESPPELEVDRNSQNPGSGNAKVDVAHYKGVVLARKRMRWKYPADLEFFKEESQTLRRMNHCHIIQILGSYTQQRDYTILLYPYCEFTLSRFMEENCQAASTDEILKYPETLRDRLYLQSFFPCLAQALMYIHTNTTRHADIKPDNILIKQSLADAKDCRRYHVYIADFGSASTYSSASRTNRFAKSTPKYCAPELAPDIEDQTKASVWGRAADVFSLGCVFAEMLTVLACKEVVAFDVFRSEKNRPGGEPLPKQATHETVDESFCKSLPRVHEWLQVLRQFAEADPAAGKDPEGYWYRRGKLLAFASWRDTFLDTLGITASMLSEKQDDRPKIAEVVRRLDVDDCCNREIIPFFAFRRAAG